MAPPGNEDQLQFQWPESPRLREYFEEPTETTATKVVDTVKNIISSFVNHTDDTTVAFDETFNNNRTTDRMDQDSLNEMFGGDSTAMEPNSTMFTEMIENNASIATFTDNLNTTDSTNGIFSTIVDSMVTTTETIFNTVSETMSPTKNVVTTTEEMVTITAEHHEEGIEDKTLYIILGIVLAALILIIITLLMVYRRYKKMHNSTSRVYCVHNTNDLR